MAAQVHTVVLVGYRGKGIGRALVAAAEQHSAQYGVSRLVAPILAPNADAISFYAQAGLGQHGILLSKELASGLGGMNRSGESGGSTLEEKIESWKVGRVTTWA